MEVKLVRGEKSILKELQCILSKEDHDKYEWTKIMPIVGYAEKQNMVKDVAEKVLSWIWSFDYFFFDITKKPLKWWKQHDKPLILHFKALVIIHMRNFVNLDQYSGRRNFKNRQIKIFIR